MYFQIDGYYEKIDNLQDIANIIRIYYNPELADKMDEMIEESDNDIGRLEELESIIYEIRMLVG